IPAITIRTPCTRYQVEYLLTVSRIASRRACAAASTDIVMACSPSSNCDIAANPSTVVVTKAAQDLAKIGNDVRILRKAKPGLRPISGYCKRHQLRGLHQRIVFFLL